jgi:transcriptional regulator with XRE-family HTH domain
MPASAGDMTVGSLIRACRMARGRSARSLSLDAGLSESVVGKVESGAIEPSLRVFAAITGELGLNRREIELLVALARRAPGGPAHD